MQMLGQDPIINRKTFAQITAPKPPGSKPKRVQIIKPTQIRGVIVYPGTVLEFDTDTLEGWDDWSILINHVAVKVPLDTPLFIAPPPVPEKGHPARFLELVGNGLNMIGDIAAELNTSKGNVAAIASRFIADGTLKVNDRGAYVLVKKA